MTLELLPLHFTVCQLQDISRADLSAPFTFLARTDREISLVCKSEKTPENALKREEGWRCFRIAGTLDFSLIGILARIAALLAEEKISLFALSTYDTDYVLIKEETLENALRALEKAGYTIVRLAPA